MLGEGSNDVAAKEGRVDAVGADVIRVRRGPVRRPARRSAGGVAGRSSDAGVVGDVSGSPTGREPRGGDVVIGVADEMRPSWRGAAELAPAGPVSGTVIVAILPMPAPIALDAVAMPTRGAAGATAAGAVVDSGANAAELRMYPSGADPVPGVAAAAAADAAVVIAVVPDAKLPPSPE